MTNFDINSAVKRGYSNLTKEEKQYVFGEYIRYQVRKQIADQNATLSSYFSQQTSNPYNRATVISERFKFFNSNFVCDFTDSNINNLINFLTNAESSTDYLYDLSDAGFNSLLRNADSFRRQGALVCFSRRKNESLPNRLAYNELVAYANIQEQTISNIISGRFRNIYACITNATTLEKNAYKEKFGHSANYARVLPECSVYKQSVGKKTAMLWNSMIDHYTTKMEGMTGAEAINYLYKLTPQTNKHLEEVDKLIERTDSKSRAHLKTRCEVILDALNIKEGDQITFDAAANLADYDEIKSSSHREQEIDEARKEAVLDFWKGKKLDVEMKTSAGPEKSIK